MGKIDLDKYRSVGSISSGAKKSVRTVPHLDDRGRPDGGKQVEHWDGRVDAHIVVTPVKAGGKVRSK